MADIALVGTADRWSSEVNVDVWTIQTDRQTVVGGAEVIVGNVATLANNAWGEMLVVLRRPATAEDQATRRTLLCKQLMAQVLQGTGEPADAGRRR